LTDKILFLIDGWFFNFGMAYHLQKLENFESYAIIDVDDKARNFYKKQNLVKFNKVWYYLDAFNTKKTTPDVNYLSNFENKYKINLWSIVYNDRQFYRYNKFHNFSYDEILTILEQDCRFFEQILDAIQPDFLSMYIPISHHQQLLLKLAKRKGIKILMFTPVHFGGRMMISEDAGMPDKWNIHENLSSEKKTFEELENFLKNHDSSKAMSNYKKAHFESHKRERYEAILRFFISQRSKNYYKRYSNFGKTRTKVLSNKISRYFQRKSAESFMNNHFRKNLDDNTNFIFFPLHSEPERALLVSAPYYTNQISVIENIAKSLPMGYKLYVKDHPGQVIYGWRDISYYKQIMSLPNVEMLHYSLTSSQVIAKSSLVISIGGTPGIEALFYNKPSIVFTDQLYSNLPSVYRITNYEELPKAIKSSLKKQIDINDLKNFVENIEKISFNFVINELMEDFTIRFGFKGPILDAFMPIEEIKSYLDVHNLEFENLAKEHQKKIQEHKLRTEQ